MCSPLVRSNSAGGRREGFSRCRSPERRGKCDERLCIKRPTRGSKSNPIYVVKVRPKVQRPSLLPAKILDPTQIGISGLEEIFCLASISAAGACGARPLPCPPPPAVEGGRELGPARCAASPRAPGDGAELPITFNVLLTFRVTGAKFRGSFHLVMPGLSRPSRSSDDVPCPYPPPLAGEGRGARDKPGDDARELFTSTR